MSSAPSLTEGSAEQKPPLVHRVTACPAGPMGPPSQSVPRFRPLLPTNTSNCPILPNCPFYEHSRAPASMVIRGL